MPKNEHCRSDGDYPYRRHLLIAPQTSRLFTPAGCSKSPENANQVAQIFVAQYHKLQTEPEPEVNLKRVDDEQVILQRHPSALYMSAVESSLEDGVAIPTPTMVPTEEVYRQDNDRLIVTQYFVGQDFSRDALEYQIELRGNEVHLNGVEYLANHQPEIPQTKAGLAALGSALLESWQFKTDPT